MCPYRNVSTGLGFQLVLATIGCLCNILPFKKAKKVIRNLVYSHQGFHDCNFGEFARLDSTIPRFGCQLDYLCKHCKKLRGIDNVL